MAAPPSKYGNHFPNMATWARWTVATCLRVCTCTTSDALSGRVVKSYVIIYYFYIVCALAAGTWRVGVARALGGTEWRGAGISDAADVATLRLTRAHTHIVITSGEGLCGPVLSVRMLSLYCPSLTHAHV